MELDKELTRETELEDDSDGEVRIIARTSPVSNHYDLSLREMGLRPFCSGGFESGEGAKLARKIAREPSNICIQGKGLKG